MAASSCAMLGCALPLMAAMAALAAAPVAAAAASPPRPAGAPVPPASPTAPGGGAGNDELTMLLLQVPQNPQGALQHWGQNVRDVLFQRIADYAGRHLQHVTNDHNDQHCRVGEKKPYSLTSCPSHRYLNVTGFDRRSDTNIEFCLASAFGAPDSVRAPPQCRWDDINDISEEMGWADAAVYNPNWQDTCSGIRANGTNAEYCDCLEKTDSYWFKVYRDNLRKYCHNKFLIVIHKMNGDIGFSQKCEVRWMIRNIGSEVKCPIVAWNFDQLWEFRNALCSARRGGNPAEDLEGLFVAGGRQTEEMIAGQLGADQSSPDYKQYMSFLSGSQASCWKS